MKTITHYLDEAVKKCGNPRQLSIKTNVRATRVYNYTSGTSIPDEEFCIKLGEVLEIDSGPILLAALAARSKCHEAKAVYERMATQCSVLFLSIFIGVLALTPSISHASNGISEIVPNVDIMRTNRHRQGAG